jgi:hypothetical protein
MAGMNRPTPPRSAGTMLAEAPRRTVGSLGAGTMGFSRGVWGLIEAGADAAGLDSLSEFAKGTGRVADDLGGRAKGDDSALGFIEKAVYGGVESIGQAAPALALGALTGQPAVTLGIMGGTTGGGAYSTGRGQGMSGGKAAAYGALEGTR